MNALKVGDVVTYTSERANSWCREGMAIARASRSGGIDLVDTYWASLGDAHVLTATEIASAVLVFNVGDYDELDQYSGASRGEWEKYAPADREVVTSQHGLQHRWFVRKGAQPDFPTQIENARERLANAEREFESARRDVEWRRQELAELTGVPVGASA